MEPQLSNFYQLDDAQRKESILRTLREQYGRIQATSDNELVFYDFIVITSALTARHTEKYLGPSNQEEYLEFFHYILDLMESEFNISYPFKKNFEELKKVLNKYSFSINSDTDVVSFLSDCLKSLEIPVLPQNERGHIRLIEI